MAEKKSSGGSKLSRTQTVTVRFDPKLRYLAELAARKQRRTVSSFIEWAVEESLSRIYLSGDSGRPVMLSDESNSLWDVDEAERFARLAISYPDLLTHDEQILWKLIGDTELLNLGRKDYSPTGQWDENNLRTLVYPEIRKNWEAFSAVAVGTETRDSLPSWKEAVIKKRDDFLTDDIPF